ncbi:MAG: hypothetical protein C4576_31470 [Desulfobacteraceae bacterium]|nr:MAG: hypothetical protein C4576_31470 [Desulfobacteraceae bacterium]
MIQDARFMQKTRRFHHRGAEFAERIHFLVCRETTADKKNASEPSLGAAELFKWRHLPPFEKQDSLCVLSASAVNRIFDLFSSGAA